MKSYASPLLLLAGIFFVALALNADAWWSAGAFAVIGGFSVGCWEAWFRDQVGA